jgi:hypothetical protein
LFYVDLVALAATVAGPILSEHGERAMTELSKSARILLEQMATHDYATLAVLDGTRTPPAVAELIGVHAIQFPEGGRENELRCRITKAGLKLYRDLGQKS